MQSLQAANEFLVCCTPGTIEIAVLLEDIAPSHQSNEARGLYAPVNLYQLIQRNMVAHITAAGRDGAGHY
jgi:hypothetical protein